jgi:hypothetical protein
MKLEHLYGSPAKGTNPFLLQGADNPRQIAPNQGRFLGVVRLSSPSHALQPMNLALSSNCSKSRTVTSFWENGSAEFCSRRNAKFSAMGAEEFSTPVWVRCRSRARKANCIPGHTFGKPQEFKELENSCDSHTWHRVCNHNSRIVPIWNRISTLTGRRQAK